MQAGQSNEAQPSPCLWHGCTEQFATQLELYNHLCTRHSLGDAAATDPAEEHQIICGWKDCNNAVTCKGGIVCPIVEHFMGHTDLSLFFCGQTGCMRSFKSHAQLVEHLYVVHSTLLHVVVKHRAPVPTVELRWTRSLTEDGSPDLRKHFDTHHAVRLRDGSIDRHNSLPVLVSGPNTLNLSKTTQGETHAGPSTVASSQDFPCPVDSCTRILKGRNGLSQHLSKAHGQTKKKRSRSSEGVVPDGSSPPAAKKRWQASSQPAPQGESHPGAREQTPGQRPSPKTQPRVDLSREPNAHGQEATEDIESEEEAYDPEFFASWTLPREATPPLGDMDFKSSLDPLMVYTASTETCKTPHAVPGKVPFIDLTNDETDDEKEGHASVCTADDPELDWSLE